MSKKQYLSREDMLKVEDILTEDVYVKQWGGWVCVKTLTGAERDKFEKAVVEYKNKQVITKDNIKAKLVALTVVNPETMEPLFTSADIEALGKKSAGALAKIYDTASKLSGLSNDDVEELAKNSD